MRKYDIKNKRNIGIIIIISVIIIIMFSLFINLFLKNDKKEYQISSNTLVFDKDKTIIKTENDAIIKTKWNKEYYLIYNNQDYELGSSAIAYNAKTGEIFLYGRYYEINSSDEINITEDETVIKSSALTKFYKLADRKYLVVDKEIKSADGILSTSDFLMIDIDKVGNATLVNHKVNLKAFSETTIITSNYTFDIANEILTYGSNKIDLKKIIGSSNTYTKEDLIPEEKNDNNNGTGSVNIVDNSTSGSNLENGSNTESSGGNGSNNNITIEEIKKATKKTSIISVTSSINKIRVDYVIYDPKSEYNSVYMEVRKEGSNNISTIYLNSSDTVYELTDNILPNTTYNLTFKYSYLDENNYLQIETFDSINITTKKPSMSVEVTRIRYNKVYYLVTTNNNYPITQATLITLINGEEYSKAEITNTLNGLNYDINNVDGSITLPSILSGDIIELRLTDAKSNGILIKDVESSYKFKY